MSPESKDFRPSVAVFDMDGLILDTERTTFEVWPQAARNLGLEITCENVTRIIGINAAAARACFIDEFGGDFPYDKLRAEARRLTQEIIAREGVDIKPGLLPLLDCLEKRRVPFAVATSTDRATAEWKLEKAGVRRRFPVLVCGDEIKNGKPSPDIFLTAAKRLSAPPRECVGFEDSGPGLLGLHAAGIASVFIRDRANPPLEVLATVWKQYKNLAEAAEIFG